MIITLGNRPSGEDGAIICDMQADGTLTYEFTMSEQGGHNIPLALPTGEIIIGGADAALGDDWTFGNIYVKSAGVWQKKRTLPNVIHVFGQTVHNGKLYVGTGAHTGDNATWEARVFWSDDAGDTWNSSYVCYYRVRDLISFNGSLYAVCYEWPNFSFYRSDDDGVTWIKMEIVPYQLPRMAIYASKLYVVDNDKTSMSVIDSGGAIASLALPGQMPNQGNVANYMAVSGNNLYVLLGTSADRVWRYDGMDWTYHCDLGESCCSLLNFENLFLIASTVGTDAKLLKVVLS